MTTTLLALALGAVIGLSLGMLGGGSILTVPALVYLLGQNPHAAISASLVVVGLNAVTGAWLHQRAGNVRLRAALVFGGAGLLAAFAGARLSTLLTDPMLLVLFALLMLTVATMMLRGSAALPIASHDTAPVWWKVLLSMSMRETAGSSLVVIAINSAAGLLGTSARVV
jgi:uncharacterized protein